MRRKNGYNEMVVQSGGDNNRTFHIYRREDDYVVTVRTPDEHSGTILSVPFGFEEWHEVTEFLRLAGGELGFDSVGHKPVSDVKIESFADVEEPVWWSDRDRQEWAEYGLEKAIEKQSEERAAYIIDYHQRVCDTRQFDRR